MACPTPRTHGSNEARVYLVTPKPWRYTNRYGREYSTSKGALHTAIKTHPLKLMEITVGPSAIVSGDPDQCFCRRIPPPPSRHATSPAGCRCRVTSTCPVSQFIDAGAMFVVVKVLLQYSPRYRLVGGTLVLVQVEIRQG